MSTSLYIVLDEHYSVQRGGPFKDTAHALSYLGPIASNEDLFVKVTHPVDPRPVYRFTTELPGFPVIDIGYRVDSLNNIDLAYVNYCKVDLVHNLRDGIREKILGACLLDLQKHLTDNNPSLPSAP